VSDTAPLFPDVFRSILWSHMCFLLCITRVCLGLVRTSVCLDCGCALRVLATRDQCESKSFIKPDDLSCECAGEDNEEEMDEGSDAEREVAEGFLEDAKFAVEDRYYRIHSSRHCVFRNDLRSTVAFFPNFQRHHCVPAF